MTTVDKINMNNPDNKSLLVFEELPCHSPKTHPQIFENSMIKLMCKLQLANSNLPICVDPMP